MIKTAGAVAKPPTQRLFKVEASPSLSLSEKNRSELRRLRDRFFKEGSHEKALQVARELVDRDPGRENYFHLGVIRHATGRPRKALSDFRDALRFRNGPKYLLPEIQLHIAYAWYRLGQHTRMQAALRRAYSMRFKPRTAPKFQLTLGGYYYSRGKYAEAAQEFKRAEDASTSVLGRSRAAANYGFALYRDGNPKEGLRHLDRALELAKRARMRGDIGITRAMRATVLFDLGHVRRALSILTRASRDFRRVGDQIREAESLQNAGYMAGELGLWSRSRTYEDRAIKLASIVQHRAILIRAYACRATACAHLEEFEKSTSDLHRAHHLLKGRINWVASLHVTRAQMRIALILENWAEASRLAQRGERLAAKVGDQVRVIEFRKARAEAEESRGRSRVAHFARKSAIKMEGLLAGSSSLMAKVAQTAEKLARSRIPVLITGEDGTGKVELAKRMHQASDRSTAPCMTVPCEQLPFPESDLAGHVAGAWSGAPGKKKGYVQKADHGTLILDRVEELSPTGQRILVRIVEGWVRPVGEAQETKVDVRVIATSQYPSRLIPDLRNRLQGAVIHVPALHERPEDISGLVKGLLKGERGITADAVVALSAHPWEGNIPELKGVLERLQRISKKVIGRKTVHRILKVKETRRHQRHVDKERQLAEMASQLA